MIAGSTYEMEGVAQLGLWSATSGTWIPSEKATFARASKVR